jgi:dTDP-4-dehydrorhamnose reductase
MSKSFEISKFVLLQNSLFFNASKTNNFFSTAQNTEKPKMTLTIQNTQIETITVTKLLQGYKLIITLL